MSTPAQIAVNPVTPHGKAVSSRNAAKHGLFSGSFIRPGEQNDYAELRAELHRRFTPADVLEELLADEIHQAIWRLRRCARVEAELSPLFAGDDVIRDPMEAIGEPVEKIQLALDRARSQAHRILYRCAAELRKLQAERTTQSPQPEEAPRLEITKRTHSDSQKRTHFESATARNAGCPCGSGQKYKRCCGRDAPPLLFAA
jgi:hypothetical protein